MIALPAAARWALSIVAAASAIVLLARLDADPPRSLSVDYALDEGYWLHNARSWVMWGDIAPGECNQGLLGAPLYTLLAAASFRVFDVGLRAARLPVALATLATAALLGLHGRREGRALLLAPCVFLASTFVTGYGHVTVMEPLASALCVAALLVGSGTSAAAAGSGVLLALAALCKPVALSALPAAMLEAWLQHRRAGRAAAVGVVALSLWLAVTLPMLLAHREEVAITGRMMGIASPVPDPLHALRNALDLAVVRTADGALQASELARLSPALVVAAALGLAAARHRQDARAMALLLASVLLPVAMLANRPGRRFILAAAPMAWLAARALEEKGTMALRPLALALAVLLVPAAGNGAWRLARAAVPRSAGIESVAAAVAAAMLAGAWILAGRRTLGPRLAAGVRAMLVLIMAGQGTWGVAAAMREPASLRNASRALEPAVRHDTVVGSAADTLCLETSARSFRLVGPFDGRTLNGGVVARGEACHALLLAEAFGRPFADPVPPGAEAERDIDLLPDEGGRARLRVRLYRLPCGYTHAPGDDGP